MEVVYALERGSDGQFHATLVSNAAPMPLGVRRADARRGGSEGGRDEQKRLPHKVGNWGDKMQDMCAGCSYVCVMDIDPSACMFMSWLCTYVYAYM